MKSNKEILLSHIGEEMLSALGTNLNGSNRIYVVDDSLLLSSMKEAQIEAIVELVNRWKAKSRNYGNTALFNMSLELIKEIENEN